jgi:hypothetical protein
MQGMQFFEFIFLKRSWTRDQDTLRKALQKLVEDGQQTCEPLWLLIFPEGLLVNEESRQEMRDWAKDKGVDEATLPKYTVMPRSTGLHFCHSQLSIRNVMETDSEPSAKEPPAFLATEASRPSTLSKRRGVQENLDGEVSAATGLDTGSKTSDLPVPPLTKTLHLGQRTCRKGLTTAIYDVTMGLEGLPSPDADPEKTYTLRSIFFQGCPPPRIHLYFRRFPVDSFSLSAESWKAELENARLDSRSPSPLFQSADDANGKSGNVLGGVVPFDKSEFHQWLLRVFKEKDDLLGYFYKNGVFPRGETGRVEISMGQLVFGSGRVRRRWRKLNKQHTLQTPVALDAWTLDDVWASVPDLMVVWVLCAGVLWAMMILNGQISIWMS